MFKVAGKSELDGQTWVVFFLLALSSVGLCAFEKMSKCKKELSERERERLLIRRASGANASQLAHMEKMLQETKGLLEKKTETETESKACDDTMGLYLNLQIWCLEICITNP